MRQSNKMEVAPRRRIIRFEDGDPENPVNWSMVMNNSAIIMKIVVGCSLFLQGKKVFSVFVAVDQW